jgi:hypothetical protein
MNAKHLRHVSINAAFYLIIYFKLTDENLKNVCLLSYE